jgi:hypothetical protein
MERPLTVGQLARATGVPAKTIRYYEQVGVLPVPRRSTAGYRHYSRHDVHRLLFIRRARALRLSLATLTWKGAAMPRSSLEPLTILSPSPSEAGCGCGCGCEVSLTQLALPQDARGRTEDPEHDLPKQS